MESLQLHSVQADYHSKCKISDYTIHFWFNGMQKEVSMTKNFLQQTPYSDRAVDLRPYDSAAHGITLFRTFFWHQ
jgi:hypothetical protein